MIPCMCVTKGCAIDHDRPQTRQDRPRRRGQRRPPGARPRRRRGRGLPRDRAQGARSRIARPTIAPAAGCPTRRPTTQGPDTVVILDFGSQFAQLIARRVRELNVYSELLPHDTPWSEIERRRPRAVILSGGPNSVYDVGAPMPDGGVWSGRIPVLGICYGAQLMAHELGGDVLAAGKREYGPASVTITHEDGLFSGLDREQPVWMSHGDSITRLPEGFERDRPDRLVAAGRLRRSGPRPVRDPVPSRGRPHPARPGHPAQLRDRDRRCPADLDAGQLHRLDGGRDPGPGRRPRPGDRLGRAGDLRPERRGRLGRRRGPRPPRRGRPADLHLRRPRPDAQARVGAPADRPSRPTSGCAW